jgi:hypothetical protein
MSIVGVNYGISDNQNSVVVESCVVQTIRFYGIIGGTVAHCHVRDCGSGGIIARTASDCVAETRGGLNSIQASVATNCSGFNSTSGAGINALSVTGCFGQSDSGVGIAADVAQNSYGFSDSGIGLNANAATNCYGQSTSSNGIHANTATGCYGFSSLNRGISTDIATSCSGRCDTGVSFGINAAHIAISSYGYSSGGIGLASYIANSCRGENSGGPSTAASFKYNMP